MDNRAYQPQNGNTFKVGDMVVVQDEYLLGLEQEYKDVPLRIKSIQDIIIGLDPIATLTLLDGSRSLNKYLYKLQPVRDNKTLWEILGRSLD